MCQECEGIKAFTAAEDLAIHRRVKLDSSGEAVYADADDVGIGTTHAAALDTYQVPVRLWSQSGTRKITAAGAFSLGDRLYGADDGKVDDAQTGGPYVLVALEAATANNDVVEAYVEAKTSGMLISAVADSTSITASSTETAFDNATTTIDGAILKAGDKLRFKIGAIASDQNSSDTMIIKLYIGTEVIFTSPTLDVGSDDDIFYADIEATIRVAGASGTLVANGVYSPFAAVATAPAEAWRLAQVSEDLSGDVAIKATAQWSTTNSGNSIECETFSVEHIRR